MPNANAGQIIPNAVTRTLVCVDAISSADYAGTLYNPYLPAPLPFGQITELIALLEEFFNRISFPQAFFESRTFLDGQAASGRKSAPNPLTRCDDDSLFNRYKGKLATFELQVQFRQNASWQGEIIWKESGKSWGFRSELEMLRLIDSVIQNNSPDANP